MLKLRTEKPAERARATVNYIDYDVIRFEIMRS